MPRALSRFVHLAALAALVAAAGCQKNARQHYEAGRRYQAEGRAREAIIEFRNAVQKDPKLGEAQRDLGRALLAAGDRNEALGAAVRAADLLPTDVDVSSKRPGACSRRASSTKRAPAPTGPSRSRPSGSSSW